VNVLVSVNVPGGHSSIPCVSVPISIFHLPYRNSLTHSHSPAHTAIGILSAFVTTIEAHPAPVKLSKSNPFAAFAQCLGEYGAFVWLSIYGR
jgi:Gly-Xaa carboxypeptidase